MLELCNLSSDEWDTWVLVLWYLIPLMMVENSHVLLCFTNLAYWLQNFRTWCFEDSISTIVNFISFLFLLFLSKPLFFYDSILFLQWFLFASAYLHLFSLSRIHKYNLLIGSTVKFYFFLPCIISLLKKKKTITHISILYQLTFTLLYLSFSSFSKFLESILNFI